MARKTKMCQNLVVMLLVLVNLVLNVSCSDIFHVKSRTTFLSDQLNSYFGYAVSLSEMGLYIGAPKAMHKNNLKSGAVYSCPVNFRGNNFTCEPLWKIDDRNPLLRSYEPISDFYKDDMWFGAVITVVPKDKLLVCAPRRMRMLIRSTAQHLLINGACYIHSKNKEKGIIPLGDDGRQAIRTTGVRKEYKEYSNDTTVNYFAFGQAGMSATVTRNNSIIIGAPGVLQWTGSVVDYKFDPRNINMARPTTINPYNTLELGPDHYFGYSIESAVFEESGTVYYAAGAPRSNQGYGQVIVFKPWASEYDALDIKARLLGPQLGSYFGASLCTIDIDADGLSDILVGAPNYAKNDGMQRYDQGAVFVYMSRKEEFQFALKEAGHLMGSGKSGARFGSSIANLGDIDGDGFNDVAIGAPFEDDGLGAVYIYKGNENGLNSQYIQRIHAAGSRGFGMAISKGYDIDKNNCNDIAIGAHNSDTAYLYRSIPTIQVQTSIRIPDAKNLKKNSTQFNTEFCVTVMRTKYLSDVEIDMTAVVSVDPGNNRARTLGNEEYIVKLKPGFNACDEQIIEVNDQSDLSKPILVKFELTPLNNLDNLSSFPSKMARISEDSSLQSSYLIQLRNDCGDDLICTPWLEMSIEPLESPYVPGSGSRLGARIIVENLEEPAFSVKLVVTVPHPLQRLPNSCLMQQRAVVCSLPAPLRRGEIETWEIDLEYAWDGIDEQVKITAALDDPLYQRNITDGPKELVIPITPESSYTVNAKSIPQHNISISRETFDKKSDIMFTHYFEVTNLGPSDFHHVEATVYLPAEVILADSIEGTTLKDNVLKFNIATLKAKTTATYVLPLVYDIDKFGEILDEKLELNVTSKIQINLQNFHASAPHNVSDTVTTLLILEPKTPIWPLIVGLITGLLLLALIIFGLYKFGFFSRQKKQELEQLIENTPSQESPTSSSSPPSGGLSNSHQDLLESDTELI